MAKAKALFPKELTNHTMEENNHSWLREYKTKNNFGKGYFQQLENFFKFVRYEKKPFNLFILDDVYSYIEVMIENEFSESRINMLVSNLSAYRNFLVDQYPEHFSINFLKNINDLRLDQPEKKYAESQALNYNQLEITKKYIKSNLRTEYIFQIFYQLGIDKKDFDICSPKNAVIESQTFQKNNRQITYNHCISEILNKINSVPNFKATPHMIRDHLKSIELYLKEQKAIDTSRSITYNDIIKTHERFFVTCPNCGKNRESISNNWVLVKTQHGDTLHLCCSDCKGMINDDTI